METDKGPFSAIRDACDPREIRSLGQPMPELSLLERLGLSPEAQTKTTNTVKGAKP